MHVYFKSPGPYVSFMDVKIRHRMDQDLCRSQDSLSFSLYIWESVFVCIWAKEDVEKLLSAVHELPMIFVCMCEH